MANLINETINTKEAILFMYGSINKVSEQFIKMLKYCKNNKLNIVDLFFDTSTISTYEKEAFYQLLDYLKHHKTKQAVVFYSRIEYNKCPWTHKLNPFRDSGQIELRFAKDNVTI